jgi:hypothetical protein
LVERGKCLGLELCGFRMCILELNMLNIIENGERLLLRLGYENERLPVVTFSPLFSTMITYLQHPPRILIGIGRVPSFLYREC